MINSSWDKTKDILSTWSTSPPTGLNLIPKPWVGPGLTRSASALPFNLDHALNFGQLIINNFPCNKGRVEPKPESTRLSQKASNA